VDDKPAQAESRPQKGLLVSKDSLLTAVFTSAPARPFKPELRGTLRDGAFDSRSSQFYDGDYKVLSRRATMFGFRNLPRRFLPLLAIPVCLWAQGQPGYQRLATVTRRIDRDRLPVVVYQGGKRVQLPRFHELVIVKPMGPIESLDRLLQTHVILAPSNKRHGEWNVYGEPADDAYLFMTVSQMDPLALPANVYQVRGVIVSSRKNRVEVHAGKTVYRLKPGEALLILD
jgi:hypothetical protein